MLREVMGLPAHALLVHAAVIFVPLLALVATGYAVMPRFRARIGWVAALLAVATPVATFLAKESGEELERVLIAKHYGPGILDQVGKHQEYGDLTFWWSLALGVATGLLLVLTNKRWRRRALPRWASLALGAAVAVLSVVNLIYIYLTGDSGAQAVWQGVL